MLAYIHNKIYHLTEKGTCNHI